MSNERTIYMYSIDTPVWDNLHIVPVMRQVVKNFKKVLQGSREADLEGWTICAAGDVLCFSFKGDGCKDQSLTF